MQAVIMAGGRGTRLWEITKDRIPKPMAPVRGKPILEYQVEAFIKAGIRQIWMITGYLHEKIESYFENGERWGAEIQYIVEKEPMGSAGALFYLKEAIQEEVVVTFGDLIFDIDMDRMRRFHEEKRALITLFVHPNSHPFDSDLVLIDKEQRVTGWHKKGDERPCSLKNRVNAGIYILSPSVFREMRERKQDMEQDIIIPMAERGEAVFAYQSPEYVKDAGTPERLKEVEAAADSGVIAGKNLRLPQKCIFIDRDGTLNVWKGLLTRKEDMELEHGAAEAVRCVNESGYLLIVVTNQPVIARNLCSFEELEEIHGRLETLLGEQGSYFDDLFFCPHHPARGYQGERTEYKVFCKCRKPGIGMLEMAAKKYHIDLSRSWIIGDTTVDVMTGKNAGVRAALVRTGEGGKDGIFPVEPDLTAQNLLDAVTQILKRERS